jgi:hypothetical protein
VLLRLAYLAATNAFAALRLLPMSNRDKDVEILALRHQIAVLQRQLGTEKVRLDASDRTYLAWVGGGVWWEPGAGGEQGGEDVEEVFAVFARGGQIGP